MYRKLAALLETATEFFCVFDEHGRIARANAEFCKILGYTQDKLTEVTMDSLFSHPADRTRNVEMKDRVLSGEIIHDFENRVKATNGRYLTCTWSAGYDPDQKMVYALGILKKEGTEETNQQNLYEKILHVIQSFNEGFLLLNNNWQITFFNPAFLAITGMKATNVMGADFKKLDRLGNHAEIVATIEKVYTERIAQQVQYHDDVLNCWLRISVFPHSDEVILFLRNITSSKIPQLILELEKQVLELNADPVFSIEDITNLLLKGIEEIFPEMFCSLMRVDEAQKHIFNLSAPRLPSAYLNAIDGLEIGASTGSCGTSVYLRRLVIVSDIENDPLWADYRQFILPYGIKACWSSPVISSDGTKVLATFGIYYKTQREPNNEELNIIERTVNLLRLIIEFKMGIAHINDQNRRLMEIASIISHELRRPVASIIGLVNLFDRTNQDKDLNNELIDHLATTSKELDEVIHVIIRKTMTL
jgi:PAS domain S-box-containing protein